MTLTVDQLLIALNVLVTLLGIIVLYHLMYITLDVRRITRRVDRVTREAEEAILKPIAMADSIVETVKKFVEGSAQSESKKKHLTVHKSSKKS